MPSNLSEVQDGTENDLVFQNKNYLWYLPKFSIESLQ